MREYVVQEAARITPSTLLLTLQRDESERPLAFQPGQYAAISYIHGAKKSTTRCFSIVSSPTDQDTLQFSMRVRGRFTTALSQLQPNDTVRVAGPFGGFVFDAGRDKHAIFMAGGIGITPFMSMMRYMAALNADNTVTLFYSCQTQDDIPFYDELKAIEAKHPNLKTVFVVGKGETNKLKGAHAASGSITEALLRDATNGAYDEYKFFICGPPPYMKAMAALAGKQGVERRRILTEAFTQSSPKQTSILRSWPANVYVLGAVGIVFGSIIVMVGDLLRALPPSSTTRPTKRAPYLVTNARQQQLDQLVNTISPSASVITAPSASSTSTPAAGTSTTPTTTTTTIQNTLSPQTAPAPTSIAPTPTSTASIPPP